MFGVASCVDYWTFKIVLFVRQGSIFRDEGWRGEYLLSVSGGKMNVYLVGERGQDYFRLGRKGESSRREDQDRSLIRVFFFIS